MSKTLEKLEGLYPKTYRTMEEIRHEFFPEISLERMYEEIHKGQIKLRYTRLRPTQKGQAVVLLEDLAKWLDSLKPIDTQPAAHQAA